MTTQQKRKTTQPESDNSKCVDDMLAKNLWVQRLLLTNFRSYANLELESGPGPVVLTGANGSGKTNILEAVSLLSAGQGLRRAPYMDLVRKSTPETCGHQHHRLGRRKRASIRALALPTSGLACSLQAHCQSITLPAHHNPAPDARYAINGEPHSGPSALNEYMDIVWMTPAMDGLFTGPASERRRFLDRLVYCFDPAFRSFTGRFERATQSRNRLLADGIHDNSRIEGFEIIMAETGTAIAAARSEAVAALQSVIADRRARNEMSPFPWCDARMGGTLEDALQIHPAVDVEDQYRLRLVENRERDRAAGRTLEGPHRSDLLIVHGPKNMPARLCSTGEQKALLLGLVLAQAELIARRHQGSAPIILLDEITAHLDSERRQALFREIVRLKAQAWMTGTDAKIFTPLISHADMFTIDNGKIVHYGP